MWLQMTGKPDEKDKQDNKAQTSFIKENLGNLAWFSMESGCARCIIQAPAEFT